MVSRYARFSDETMRKGAAELSRITTGGKKLSHHDTKADSGPSVQNDTVEVSGVT